MNKKILLIPLAVLLLSAMIAPALAQKELVGVQVGDWFLYEGTLVSWEADAGVAFPPFYATYLYDWNNTNWYNYTVTDIDADWVNFTVVTSWTNGSGIVTTNFANNITGSSEIMVIGSNLTQGELIRGPDFLNAGNKVLNASIMLDTPNGTREMNVLNYTTSLSFGGGDPSIYTYLYYWDSVYGIQVYREYSGTVPPSTTGGYSYIGKLELVDSSLGVVVPDLTGPLLLLTIMSITVPIALLHRRKKPRLI